MAVYCEGQITNELIAKTGYIMPDGTSTEGESEIEAIFTKVADKIRALKLTSIKKGKRENWASAVVYILDPLATASSSTINSIWKNISSILSDLCKVNRNLSLKSLKMVGATGKPGQQFCKFHFILAVLEGIKAVMTEYQSCIGAVKLFPKTVGFEMNLEGSLIFIQILDC